MVVIFLVEVFWVLMLCSIMVGYLHFIGPCCLHLWDEISNMGENSMDRGLDWRGVAGATSQ